MTIQDLLLGGAPLFPRQQVSTDGYHLDLVSRAALSRGSQGSSRRGVRLLSTAHPKQPPGRCDEANRERVMFVMTTSVKFAFDLQKLSWPPSFLRPILMS